MNFSNLVTPIQEAIPTSCISNTVITVHAYTSSHTHTHTHLTAFFPGLPGWAGTRKVKPILILLEQETVSGSGISWAICNSAPRSRQITMPAPHHSSFLQAGCPSCRPTDSVKALKAIEVRLYFFSEHIINIWNDLPGNIVDFRSLSFFKRTLHKVNLSSYLV